MTLLETTLASLSALSLNARGGSNQGPSSFSSTAKRSHWSLKAAQRPASPIDVRSFPNHDTPPLHGHAPDNRQQHNVATLSDHALCPDTHQSAHDVRARHFHSLEQARFGAVSALLQYLQRYEIATVAAIEAWRTRCTSTTSVAATTTATAGRAAYTLVLVEIADHCQAVVAAMGSDCSIDWEPEAVHVLLVGCWTAHCACLQHQHQQAARFYQSLRRQRLEQCPPHLDDPWEDAVTASVSAPVMNHPSKRRPHVVRLRIGLASQFKEEPHSTSSIAATVDVVEQARLSMLACAEESCDVQRHLILAQRLRQPSR
jgi:hypothetical protein